MAPSEISVQVQHPSLSVDVDLTRRVVHHVAEQEQAHIGDLTLVFADHRTVHQLNRDYLGHDFYTDVLAFDYTEDSGGEEPEGFGDAEPEGGGGVEGVLLESTGGDRVIDGEIYVDLDTAAERHAEFDASFEEEALRYAVHGLLHLIGFGDETDTGRREMRALEDRYLHETGVSQFG